MKTRNAILCLFALAAPLRAGELNPAEIPSNAEWLLHADLDSMRGSETGKAVFAEIENKHGDHLRAFKRMFSIHPVSDLRDVTLYGDGKKDHAVVLIDGTFDKAHMEEVVKSADDYSSSDYSGVKVHTWKDKGTTQHAAFASESLLVFSRQETLLKGALDTLKGGAPGSADAFFTADGSKPLICGRARLAGIELPADAARILKMARGLKLAVSETAGRFNVRAGVEAADAAAADRMRRMLDGVIAFAEVADPKLEGLDLKCDIAAMPDKPGIAATLSLPVGEWLGLMKKAADEKK
ncbi:hypothetical protein OJ996_08680 [Luteolibacter sp. GHJ8]|uniref:DUF2066 domain-containing protein n=1 Tax=Luteolibacter rhizosphaerae TaxID=2989719 RepID=A0ABT3G1D1_9BACT|nr:hypothetical protein [Luteolibacter rhizosphaerae]MCW1913648.1 hypothetical protein [Luteolibacter rhizosphaerae]